MPRSTPPPVPPPPPREKSAGARPPAGKGETRKDDKQKGEKTSTAPPPPPPASPPLPTAAATPPPPVSPADEFVAQLKKVIENRGAIGLTSRARKKLLAQAAEKFQLAPVYAGHLIDNVLQDRIDAAAEAAQPSKAPHKDATTAEAPPQKPAAEEAEPPDPLLEFHRRAQLVLAQQRGLNTQSRLRLEVLGRELAITGEAFDEALARLTGGEEKDEDRAEMQALERQVAFQTFAAEQLARVQATLMTQSMHNKLVQAGMERFGVDFESAGRITVTAANARGMSFISTEKALRHVERLYAEVSAGQTRITPAARRRLHAEGRQWGLTVEQVDELIRGKQSGQRHSSARRRKRVGLVLAGCGAVAVAVLLVLGYWATIGNVPDGKAAETNGNGRVASTDNAEKGKGDGTASSPGNGPPEDGVSGDGPTRKPLTADWWDTRLTENIVKTKISIATARPALEELVRDDAATRGAAYRKLVAIGQRLDGDGRRALLESLLAGCHALDPSDSAAKDLRLTVLDVVPEASSDLPDDPRRFEDTYWATRLLVAAAFDRGIL